MPRVNIDIWAEAVEVAPDATRSIRVDVRGVEVSDLVGQVGEAALLDEIGEEAVIKYFGIEVVG